MNKIESGQTEYQAPDPEDLLVVEAEQLGRRALADLYEGYRVIKIEDDQIVREPRQDGVLRYPPVLVQVEGDPARIKNYIKMEPTPLSFWEKLRH